MPRTRGSSMATSCRPQNGVMHAVGIEQLGHLPFVRHQIDPERVRGAWCCGDAAAVVVRRPMADTVLTEVTGFGGRDLGGLLDGVAGLVEMPHRARMTAPADAFPAQWRVAPLHQWHWMLTSRAQGPAAVEIVPVPDAEEVNDLIDVVAPDSHARPGTPGIETWLGIRDEARLVAVGAVLRQPDGTGHVRGVAVAESHRGRGLGRELSRALTRAAMTDSGVCSLGVYVDNEPALRTYRSLGYEVVHTFTSGPVNGSSSTTASAPSR